MRDSDYSHPNHLLAALMGAGSERLLSGLEMVTLKFGDVLYESESRIRYAYLPTTSIVSLVYMMEDGATDEIAAVGNEGIIGVPLFMGSDTTPSRAVVRCAGSAFRLKGHLLLDEFQQSMAVQLRGLAKRFGQVVAVAGADLDVRRGSFFGLLGPNGAGKTTTLAMATGLLRPDAGGARCRLGFDVRGGLRPGPSP